MSTLPDNEFDLEKLFLPAWAQEPAAAKYAHYEGGEDERPDRRRDRRGGPRPPRPEGRREGGDRPRGDRRGPRPEGDRGGRPGGGPRQDNRRGEPRERREPPKPLPELEANFVPDEKGVESLAKQIKVTGRAYPLFDIAQMILQKPERHHVVLNVKKNAEGQPMQPLFVCALDDTLWLSQEEAMGHVLRKHFATFYQTEKTPTEPPKGKYTFVAQCGMSGVILGPPNHHDYQNQLRKLHSERYSRMPFEVYKSRVRIVRDEAVVKQWVEDQSFKTEFICLNQPEPLRLPNMDAVEKHFREIHLPNIVKQVDSHTLLGTAAKAIRSPELSRLVRTAWEDQRRFPLQIATVLSQQFSGHGLQFFKVNKAITHVSVARPHYLDLAAAPVSEGIRKIVEFINAHPRCNRRHLIEALAPTPPPPPMPVGLPAPEAAAAGAAPAPVPAPEAAAPTPEQTAVIADLHWLIHQGHVIEFANGILETAKRPIPKPPKPEPKKPVEKPAEATAATVAAGAAAVASISAEPEAATPAAASEPAAAPAPETAPADVVVEIPPAAAPLVAENPPIETEPVPVPATSPMPEAEEKKAEAGDPSAPPAVS